jgi:FKBP-type peptidyl-prolyl cis-trans isomerase FkpA/FKBP-type peptidyl-prolyl cis-trans isomerase FklB
MRYCDRWTSLALAAGLLLPAVYSLAQSEVTDETILEAEARDKPSPPGDEASSEMAESVEDAEAMKGDDDRKDVEIVTQGELEGEPVDDGFDSDKARRSYAIGMNIAQSFEMGGLDIDPEIVAEGLVDQASGEETRLSQQRAESILMVLQQEMMAKQQQMRAEQMQQMQAEQEKLGAENTAKGQKFLDENKEKDAVKVTDSGLQYEIVEEGDGPKPGPNDSVTIHYTGQLIDGTEFDTSRDGDPITYDVDGFVPGFSEGLQLMNVGSKAKLYIPGDIGYGLNAPPAIGPNSVLIFDVELLDAKGPKATELEPLGD